MSREEIIKHIKNWMQADEEIKQLQKVIKEKKELKKEAADVLINVMKENDLDSFDLKEGRLVHAQRKTKQSISKKFLQDTFLFALCTGIADIELNTIQLKAVPNDKGILTSSE